MTIKPIDHPLDVTIWKYEYIKYAMAIYPIVPVIKKLIEDSDKKLVIVSAEDIIKEMGANFKDKSFGDIYTNLKFIMFVHGIIINSSEKRLFIMRLATYKDKMPKYWKKRSRFLKKFMKSSMWKEMMESRTTSNSASIKALPFSFLHLRSGRTLLRTNSV